MTLTNKEATIATILIGEKFRYVGEVDEEIYYFFDEVENGIVENGIFSHIENCEGYYVGEIYEFEVNVIFPEGQIFSLKIPHLFDEEEGYLPLNEQGEIIKDFSIAPLIEKYLVLIKKALYDWEHEGQLSFPFN